MSAKPIILWGPELLPSCMDDLKDTFFLKEEMKRGLVAKISPHVTTPCPSSAPTGTNTLSLVLLVSKSADHGSGGQKIASEGSTE